VRELNPVEFRDTMRKLAPWVFVIGIVGILGMIYVIYSQFRIDVPTKHFAVLIKKTGKDITNDMECAPDETYKGVQKELLMEGRYFRNPFEWDWEVHPYEEISANELGVLVRLNGENLPYRHFVASKDFEKGIVEDVLRPGRYPIHPYTEKLLRFKPITIPAGHKGVVTLLAAPMPDNPNALLVEPGRRGVQKDTLDPGTYYVNPYVTRINEIDCRSQRFNLSEGGDMGFPSLDGFWVQLDGIVEFRVNPEKAAEVFVIYNEAFNDQNGVERVNEEIISKIILPNARSFCRLKGSNNKGRDFIGGQTRIEFQKAFAEAMDLECKPLGIEIVQALITEIFPPEAIAGPVRDREVARQKLRQYGQQILQQESEIKLAVEKQKVIQKQELRAADQSVVTDTVAAKQKQQVAVTKANEQREVARFKLNAAKDEAEAIIARGEAAASVITFDNQAIAAGWQRAIKAFGGDGDAYADFTLWRKIAPSFRKIMTNTNNSPLMEHFGLSGGNQISPPEPTPSEK